MTRITEDWIARAVRAGACREARAWLRARPRTLAEMAREHPIWLLWAAGHVPGAAEVIPPRVLARAARRVPYFGLTHAAEYLSARTLAYCARLAPHHALRFAAAHLPRRTLVSVARREPRVALAHAAPRLSPRFRRELAAAVAGADAALAIGDAMCLLHLA